MDNFHAVSLYQIILLLTEKYNMVTSNIVKVQKNNYFITIVSYMYEKKNSKRLYSNIENYNRILEGII